MCHYWWEEESGEVHPTVQFCCMGCWFGSASSSRSWHFWRDIPMVSLSSESLLLLLWVWYYNLLIVLMHNLTACYSILTKRSIWLCHCIQQAFACWGRGSAHCQGNECIHFLFQANCSLNPHNKSSKCLCVTFVWCYSLDLSTMCIQSSLIFTKAMIKSWMNWRVTVLAVLA